MGRLGGGLADWMAQPWEWVVFWFLTLQDGDRSADWIARVQRFEAAHLMALAFHQPEKLTDERSRLLAAAAATFSAESVEDIRARALLHTAALMRATLVEVC